MLPYIELYVSLFDKGLYVIGWLILKVIEVIVVHFEVIEVIAPHIEVIEVILIHFEVIEVIEVIVAHIE